MARRSIVAHISVATKGEIHTLVLNEDDGKLVRHKRVRAGETVMPIVLSPDGTRLYAAVRSQPYCIVTYAVDKMTGALHELQRADLPYSMTAISVDRSGRWLFATAYREGMVSVSPIDADGCIHRDPIQIAPSGKYSHAVKIDATNTILYAPCLGDDKIEGFHFDQRNGRLTRGLSFANVTPGSGPRHIVFSPDDRFVYVISEMTAEISQFEPLKHTGALNLLGSVGSLPPHSRLEHGVARPPYGSEIEVEIPESPIYAADLEISPDGRFMFASERTGSTVSLLTREVATGAPMFARTYRTEKTPVALKVDPTGSLLLVAGEDSEYVAVFAIDGQTGELTEATRIKIGLGGSCIAVSALNEA